MNERLRMRPGIEIPRRTEPGFVTSQNQGKEVPQEIEDQPEHTETSVEKHDFIEMLDFLRLVHVAHYERWRTLPSRLDMDEIQTNESLHNEVLDAIEYIKRIDDADHTKLALFEKMRKSSERYARIIRHDIGTSAAGVFGPSHEFLEELQGKTRDEIIKLEIEPYMLDSIKNFIAHWPRFYVGIEHLALHALEDGEFPEAFRDNLDLHVIHDATIGWRDEGHAERIVIRGKEEKKEIYSLKSFVTIDPSFHKILGGTSLEKYEGNTGMLGHSIRSCLHNSVKSRDGGAQTIIRAEIDPASEDIIITISDNGDGIHQEQFNSKSPNYIFKEGKSTSQTGSTGIGLAGLDVDLPRFHVGMKVTSKHGVYPLPKYGSKKAIQMGMVDRMKYSVSEQNEPASTMFQFRIKKKKV